MKKLSTLFMVSFLMMTSAITNAQCDAPTGLTYSYSNNVSTFSWNPVLNANEYFVELDWAGGGWSFGEMSAGQNNTYSINGLMQGGNFQWRVRASCTSGFSAYSSQLFTTPCVSPYGLATTNIGTNSATLNWLQSPTLNTNNTGFSVSYRLANTSNAWIQLTNTLNNPTATFFNLTGLAAGTAYEWRVRRVCASINSDYIYSQFVTLSCISNGNNTSEWINYFKLGTINRTSVAEPGGYANINASTDLVIGSTNNAGQIGAGFPGNPRNERFMVYIDFNRNGSFADAGEALINSTNAGTINGTTIKNFNIAIPATASAGPTRMRVIMRRANSTISSCITGYNGETEDYNVNLITGLAKIVTAPFAENDNKVVYTAKVSPNPSTGLFDVRLIQDADANYFEVIDINGTVIQKNFINTGLQFRVNITNKPKGLYLLRITYKTGKQQTVKLNKQ